MLVTRTRVCVAAYAHLMNRQQTLGKFLFFCDHNHSIWLYRAGKFFEMPRNVKPTPPQQSSLAEMWGKKKRKVDQPPPAVPASASEDGEEKKEPSEERRDGTVNSSPGG